MIDHMGRELHLLLQPFERRIRRRQWLRRFGVCMCAGIGAGVAVLLLSFVIPIPHSTRLAAAIVAGIWLISAGVLAFLRPKPIQLAMEIDRCGLQERVQTFISLQGSDSAFARLQREDTLQALRSVDPKVCIPVEWPRRPLWLTGAGLLAACVLALLPSPHDAVLEHWSEIDRVMREQAELVETSLDLLDRDTALGDAQKAELNDKLRELAKELRSGRDYRESVKRISQLQQQIAELQRELGAQGVRGLQSLLSQQSDLEEMADRLEGLMPQQAAEEIRQAIQQAQQGEDDDDDETQSLAQALRRAAREADSDELRDALNALAEGLEQGDAEAVASASQSLEDAMNAQGAQAGGSVGQISDRLKLTKNRIGQLSQGSGFQGNSTENGAAAQGDQAGGLDEQGTGQGSGGQNGTSGNAGAQGNAGARPDSGGQGSGDAPGSGQADGNAPGGASGGQGAGWGSGALVESEKIYAPERIAAEGGQERLQGEADLDGPKQQAETGPDIGTLDGYIPYSEVAGEYGEDAVNAAKRDELPPAVQEWVEGYFSALQQ